MANPTLIKNFTAAEPIGPHRIVVFGAAPGTVRTARAFGDPVIGVADALGAKAAGERIDVILSGIAEVAIGGTVAAGEPLQAGPQGDAVKFAAPQDSDIRAIGLALAAGVAGDIGQVLVAPFVYPQTRSVP